MSHAHCYCCFLWCWCCATSRVCWINNENRQKPQHQHQHQQHSHWLQLRLPLLTVYVNSHFHYWLQVLPLLYAKCGATINIIATSNSLGRFSYSRSCSWRQHFTLKTCQIYNDASAQLNRIVIQMKLRIVKSSGLESQVSVAKSLQSAG